MKMNSLARATASVLLSLAPIMAAAGEHPRTKRRTLSSSRQPPMSRWSRQETMCHWGTSQICSPPWSR